MRRVMFFLPWWLALLSVGCQDGLGFSDGEPEADVSEPDEGGEDAGQGATGGANNIADNHAGGEGASGFTPAQEASRGEEGRWSNMSQVTVVPLARQEHADNDVYFCWISYKASSIVILEVKQEGDLVHACSTEPYNTYDSAYRPLKVERLKHIAGTPLPTMFDMVSFSRAYAPRLEEGKAYLMGLVEHDGEVYGHGSHLEVIPYSAEQESRRIIFSGKFEALEALGDAHLSGQGQGQGCTPGPLTSFEDYRRYYLERDPERCERLHASQ